VPHAIGQSFDWLVSAEAELLGARVADRPPAFPLAEAQAAGPARFCRLARRARAAAIDYLIYLIVKFAGAYAAVLGGLDALVFTAGIGENCAIAQRW